MVTASAADDVPLLAVGTDSREILRRQAGHWGLPLIVSAMQILAETKSRMQRVSYGRALSELALVRISLLADLDCLDDLIAQLKGGTIVSGGGGGGRIADPTVSVPKTSVISNSPQIQAAQKKNDVTEQSFSSSMPQSSAILPVAAKSKLPTILWNDCCGNDLQSAIASQLNDMTGTYLLRVKSTAIIGPNTLEFSLPLNYDLERKALERPETMATLETIASELVGQAVRIRIRVTEAVESPARSNPATVAANRIQVIEDPDDPYLEDVAKTFGVKNWVLKEMAIESRENDPSQAGTE